MSPFFGKYLPPVMGGIVADSHSIYLSLSIIHHIDRSILTGGKHLPKKADIHFIKLICILEIDISSYNQKTMSITTETFFKMMEENDLPTLTREDLDELDANTKKMSMPHKGCYDCKKHRHLEREIDGKTYCLECAPKHEVEKPKPKKKKLIIKGSDEWREKRLKKLNKQLKQEKKELAEYLESINK